MAGIQVAIDLADGMIASGDCTEGEEQMLETLIESLQNYEQ